MRKAIRVVFPASALLVCASGASSAQSQEVSVTDEAEPIHGATVVRDLPSVALSNPAGTTNNPGGGGAPIAQLPGWPKLVGGNQTFAPQRGVVFADLDGDGLTEIILSSTDRFIYAWDGLGNAMPGFPVGVVQTPQYAPSVADLEGDGDLEIVQFTRGLTSGGRFYVIDHTGAVVPGFPKSVGNNNLAGSPTLYDLDDDGVLEILVPERDYPIGHLHVFEPDGTEWGSGWPVDLDHVPTGSPAVADVDGNGSPEIFYLSYDSVFAFDTNGTPLPGWPVTIGGGTHHSYTSPALADLDQDGDLEIVLGAHQGASGYYAFHHDGTPLTGWPRTVGTWTYAAPTIVDIEGDGDLEVIGGREGTVSAPSIQLFAWNANGSTQAGFPFSSSAGGYGGGCSGPVTAADLDGDGQVELFADRSILENGQGFLWGLNHDGSVLPGFPLRPDGFTYFNGAQITDVDGDGDFELAVVSRLDLNVWVNLYDLSGAHDPADIAWETYHATSRRGGDPGSRDTLHTRGEWTVGTTVEVQVLGDPGDLVVVGTSFTTGALQIGADWWYLGAPFRRLTHLAPIPASGQFTLPIPLPAITGTTLHLQAAKVTPSGTVLTNMVTRMVR